MVAVHQEKEKRLRKHGLALNPIPHCTTVKGLRSSSLSLAKQQHDSEAEKTTARIAGSSSSRDRLMKETNQLLKRIYRKDKLLDVEDCYSCMEAWMYEAERGSSRYSPNHNLRAAQRAHEILSALEGNRNLDGGPQTTVLIPPRPSFYNIVLHAYAVSGAGRPAAEAAERLLDRMLHHCRLFRDRQQQNNHQPQSFIVSSRAPFPPEPSTISFNIVVNAWAKSGSDDAGTRAEAILANMELWKQECANSPNGIYHGCQPTLATWSSVMNAWSRRSTLESRTRVVEILHLIKAHHEKAKQESLAADGSPQKLNSDLTITPQICNIALKVFVDPTLGREGALQAEQVLRFYQNWHEMDGLVARPDIRSYALLMDAWANCRTQEGAQRAQDILDTIIQMYKEGKSDVTPNVIAFCTAISAWAKLHYHQDREAPEKAEQLLLRLVELYKETGNEDLRPTVDAGNSCVAAWTRAWKRPDSMDRAYQVFDKIKPNVKPDIVTYNTLLNGLFHRNRGVEALKLLQWLESSPLEPDSISYNTTISAISRTRSMKAAEAVAVLDRMKKRSNKMKPNRRLYTSVLMCWVNRAPITIQDAERAAALIQDMQHLAGKEGEESSDDSKLSDGLEPDAFLLNVFIRVCSVVEGTSEEKQRALEMALGTLQELERQQEPIGPETYDVMMRAYLLCENVEERSLQMRSFFQKCAQNGFVSVNIVKSMVTGGLKDVVHNLRPAWSQNVPRKNWPWPAQAPTSPRS